MTRGRFIKEISSGSSSNSGGGGGGWDGVEGVWARCAGVQAEEHMGEGGGGTQGLPGQEGGGGGGAESDHGLSGHDGGGGGISGDSGGKLLLVLSPAGINALTTSEVSVPLRTGWTFDTVTVRFGASGSISKSIPSSSSCPSTPLEAQGLEVETNGTLGDVDIQLGLGFT